MLTFNTFTLTLTLLFTLITTIIITIIMMAIFDMAISIITFIITIFQFIIAKFRIFMEATMSFLLALLSSSFQVTITTVRHTGMVMMAIIDMAINIITSIITVFRHQIIAKSKNRMEATMVLLRELLSSCKQVTITTVRRIGINVPQLQLQLQQQINNHDFDFDDFEELPDDNHGDEDDGVELLLPPRLPRTIRGVSLRTKRKTLRFRYRKLPKDQKTFDSSPLPTLHEGGFDLDDDNVPELQQQQSNKNDFDFADLQGDLPSDDEDDDEDEVVAPASSGCIDNVPGQQQQSNKNDFDFADLQGDLPSDDEDDDDDVVAPVSSGCNDNVPGQQQQSDKNDFDFADLQDGLPSDDEDDDKDEVVVSLAPGCNDNVPGQQQQSNKNSFDFADLQDGLPSDDEDDDEDEVVVSLAPGCNDNVPGQQQQSNKNNFDFADLQDGLPSDDEDDDEDEVVVSLASDCNNNVPGQQQNANLHHPPDLPAEDKNTAPPAMVVDEENRVSSSHPELPSMLPPKQPLRRSVRIRLKELKKVQDGHDKATAPPAMVADEESRVSSSHPKLPSKLLPKQPLRRSLRIRLKELKKVQDGHDKATAPPAMVADEENRVSSSPQKRPSKLLPKQPLRRSLRIRLNESKRTLK